MKRILLLTVCAAVFLSVQFLINCSSPLDSPNGSVPTPPGPTPPETVFFYDTVFLSDSGTDSTTDTIYDTTVVVDTVHDSTADTIYDTLVVIDTISDSTSDTVYDTTIVVDTVNDTIVDSLIVIDTVLNTVIDTIYIPGADTCDFSPSCAEFNKHNQKIYWKLHNDAGRHHLEFTASFGEECFDQILHIHIKGKKYEWDPTTNPVFTLDTDLRQDAKIMIHCKSDSKNDKDDGRLSGGGNGNDDDDCDDDDGVGHDDDDDDEDHQNCCNVEVCLKVTKL